MPPSPTIPTSFVPKQPVRSAARFERSGGNAFLVLALFILGVVVVAAGAVFGYERFLKSAAAAKASELEAAERAINPDAVEKFIRFRDRFQAANDLLNQHVASSHFFDLLEKMTLVNVRFDSLTVEVLDDGSALLELSGVARSFNALAAQSAKFSEEKRIKRAVFSDISPTDTGTVEFSVSADIDARLFEFTLEGAGTIVAPAGAQGASLAPSTTTAPAAPASAPAAAPLAPTTP